MSLRRLRACTRPILGGRMRRGKTRTSRAEELFAQGAVGIGGLVAPAPGEFRHQHLGNVLEIARRDRKRHVEPVDVGGLEPCLDRIRNPFRRADDNLITRGPYALVRHPQFLSAIGITFFSVRLYNPTGFAAFGRAGYLHSLDANWALLTLALWVLAILEDRELAKHFGEEYEEYARRVPRVLPN